MGTGQPPALEWCLEQAAVSWEGTAGQARGQELSPLQTEAKTHQ